MKALHAEGKSNMGLGKVSIMSGCLVISLLDMARGTVGEMNILGIVESYLVKRQVLLSASEAAEMILRVDDIIKAAPR